MSDSINKRDQELLALIGLEPPKPNPPKKFLIWYENRQAVMTFLRVIKHRQFITVAMGGVFALDGNYLINYLKLFLTDKKIPAMLDAIHALADGYIQALNEKA